MTYPHNGSFAMRRYIGKATVCLTISALIAIAAFLAFRTVASPHDVAITRLTSIEYRLRAFTREHGRPPSSLAELTQRPGYNDSIVDGWGNDILYVASESNIKLLSCGPDGIANTDDDVIRVWEQSERSKP